MITFTYNGQKITSLREIDRVNDYRANGIISLEDLSDDSGEVLEPVSLQEVKDYLRLEGSNNVVSGLSTQTPISVSLPGGAASIAVPQLVGAVIISLSRDGQQYTQGGTAGNQVFSFDSTTGVVTFNNVANPGGEPLGISFGYSVGGGTLEDFTFDDGLISDMITEARMWIEKFTGVQLTPKLLQVILSNAGGYMELPGPVTGVITADNVELTLLGSSFPKIKSPIAAEITLQYTAGYNAGTVPGWAKNAIKAYCVWAYEHRGDETNLKGTPERAISICKMHRRTSAWA